MCTQHKEDLYCTSAELVYDTTLQLSGESFDERKAEATPDPACYVTRPKNIMYHLQATPVCKQNATNTYVSPILKSCTIVFVRHYTVENLYRSPMMEHTKYKSVQTNISQLKSMDIMK